MAPLLARAALAALLPLGAGGCLSAGPGCTPAPAPALNVTIVDAVTGAYRAEGARAVVTDGSFRAELAPGDFAPGGERATRHGPFGREGVYDIVVTHPGYETWRAGGVRVRRDRCGVVTVPVRAALTATG